MGVLCLHFASNICVKWNIALFYKQISLHDKLLYGSYIFSLGYQARCSSVVRAFAHGTMGLHGGPNELFLVPASDPRLV